MPRPRSQRKTSTIPGYKTWPRTSDPVRRFKVEATFDGEFWNVSIPGVDAVSGICKRRSMVDEVARSILAHHFRVHRSQIEVDSTAEITHEAIKKLDEYKVLDVEMADVVQRWHKARYDAARALFEAGYSGYSVAHALGMNPNQATRILRDAPVRQLDSRPGAAPIEKVFTRQSLGVLRRSVGAEIGIENMNGPSPGRSGKQKKLQDALVDTPQDT